MTGDIGVMDQQGFVTLQDRSKDVIISGGSNVYPREVEDVVMAMPGIDDAVVFGLDDAFAGGRVALVYTGADDVTEADAHAALQQLDPLWDELFPTEQARIVTLLVERVDIGTDGLNVRLRVDGLRGLAREILAGGIEAAA